MIIALIYVDMPNRLAQPDFPTLNPERHCFPRPVTFDFASRLAAFREFGKNTRQVVTQSEAGSTPTFVNEFWTARQRQACSLHEVSYRACFKPQLPRFFIERLTQPGDVVYDPFMGRGTTPIEAALLGRVPWGNDINPISLTFTRPRLRPPTLEELVARLKQFNLADHDEFPEDLLAFYHPETLREICALKKYFLARRVAHGASVSDPARFSKAHQRHGSDTASPLDAVDDWLCVVALNRLTGHSPGSVSRSMKNLGSCGLKHAR